MQEVEQQNPSSLSKDERKRIEIEEGLENLSHYLDGLSGFRSRAGGT